MASAIGTLHRAEGLLIGPDELRVLQILSRNGVELCYTGLGSRSGYRLCRGEEEETVHSRVVRSMLGKELLTPQGNKWLLTDRGRRVLSILQGT